MASERFPNAADAPAWRQAITVHSVEVKDVMFPAELKRAFAEALRSKREGQAALERARAETPLSAN